MKIELRYRNHRLFNKYFCKNRNNYEIITKYFKKLTDIFTFKVLNLIKIFETDSNPIICSIYL